MNGRLIPSAEHCPWCYLCKRGMPCKDPLCAPHTVAEEVGLNLISQSPKPSLAEAFAICKPEETPSDWLRLIVEMQENEINALRSKIRWLEHKINNPLK